MGERRRGLVEQGDSGVGVPVLGGSRPRRVEESPPSLLKSRVGSTRDPWPLRVTRLDSEVLGGFPSIFLTSDGPGCTRVEPYVQGLVEPPQLAPAVDAALRLPPEVEHVPEVLSPG